MDQMQTQATGQEARDERRQQWLERVSRELDGAEEWAASRDPERLAGHLDRMIEAANDSDVLSPGDKVEVRNRVRGVKAEVYVRHVDFLLEQAMSASRDKDRLQERAELLRRVNEGLNIVARLGVGDPIKQGIKDRLDIVRQTSAAGDSTKAKTDADREAARVVAAYPHEHRTFTRWREPPIVVAIQGCAFNALDWSLGGVLLGDVENCGWKCGQPIDVKVGLTEDELHSDRMIVVRYDLEQKRLALRARRFGSVLLQVKRDCERAGIEPI